MLAATVKNLNIKIATCPYCNRQRPYYLDDGNSPIPLSIPFYNTNQELKEVRTNYDPGNLISSFLNKSCFIDSGANYKDDDLIGKFVEIIDEDLKVLETHIIKSNTKDTIQIKDKFNGHRFYKQYSINTPFYRFKDEDEVDSDKAKKSLYVNNIFKCECGNRYTVEKV
jgi:hypothetical protein